MSYVLVGVGLWLAGLISGIMFGGSDRKYNTQTVIGMIFVPVIGIALFFFLVSLIWEIVPLISLEATSKGIMEFFAHD